MNRLNESSGGRSADQPRSPVQTAWLAITASLCSLSVSAGSVWPQFRGPNCAGVSDSDAPPVQFGPTTNLLWKVELPAGWSSPSIWQDHIFLIGFESQKLETICIRRQDGDSLAPCGSKRKGRGRGPREQPGELDTRYGRRTGLRPFWLLRCAGLGLSAAWKPGACVPLP
jgi:hypothetical protein